MVSLTVRHPDGSTETIPETSEWTRTRELGKMRRAQITVERSLAEAVSLTKKRDIIELGNVDTLVLVDIQGGGSTRTLVCYSYEWLANRYAHLPGGATREGDDNALITDLVNDVSEWTAGTIANLTGPMSYVFNHAHRHDALRRIERNTPGELRFYDEGTVEYVDALGSDKSGTIELSGSAGTIEESINITERGREYDGTHVRLIGAHEGEAQYSANLVPQGDPYDYENDPDFPGVVRYSTPRWTEDADTDWDIWKNKDVADQQTIEEEAAALGEELTESLVDVETTVAADVDITVGDYVQVVKPSANLNRTMRVHRIKEVVSGATKQLKTLLSTRTTMRQSDDEQLEGIRQFNTSYQGSSVAVNGGPVRGAVDATHDLSFGFRYPDLEYENTAEIQVKTLPYRIDSQGAASGGGAFVTSESGESHTHDVTISDTTAANTEVSVVDQVQTESDLFDDAPTTWGTLDFFEPLVNTEYVILNLSMSAVNTGGNNGGLQFRVSDESGNFYPDDDFFGTSITTENGPQAGSLTFVIPGDFLNEQLTLEWQGTDADDGASWGTSWTAFDVHQHNFTTTETSEAESTHTHDVDVPNHTHDPQPGIYETADTPSNVDVLINGSTVATDIGTGTFETTVDIAGELTTDAWNDIAISSDSLGLAQASVFVEGYDKIGTQ